MVSDLVQSYATMLIPRVKVCCISSIEEAQLAIRYGASALGLVSAMPSGPGIISDECIAEIAALIPPAVASVLLTSKTDVAAIIDQQKRYRVNTLQLCDRLAIGTHEDLRTALPGVAVIQVVHVTGIEALHEAKTLAPQVDGLLLDSGNPTRPVKELGGTGRVHNWAISRQIREVVDGPIFLAGGLRSSNVVTAMETVQPYGLDVCSGVRTEGRLDEAKLVAFFERIWKRILRST